MKWCSSGMHDAPEEGGEWIAKKGRQGTRRWQCRTCKANKKPPNRDAYSREPANDRAPADVGVDRTDPFSPFGEGVGGGAT